MTAKMSEMWSTFTFDKIWAEEPPPPPLRFSRMKENMFIYLQAD